MRKMRTLHSCSLEREPICHDVVVRSEPGTKDLSPTLWTINVLKVFHISRFASVEHLMVNEPSGALRFLKPNHIDLRLRTWPRVHYYSKSKQEKD